MKNANEYYYGLPQEIWDSLVMEAEDLLSDEQLGNHIVGLYPAGSRIYGLESSSPGLLCLYVDAAESILDPLPLIHDTVSNWKYGWECKSYRIGENLNEIYFIELHDWIKNFIKLYLDLEDVTDRNLFALIPICSDVIYQSESIDKIIGLCANISKSFTHNLRRERFAGVGGIKNRILLLRTLWIWEKHKVFCPNINKDWGQVFDIEASSIIEETDKNFIYRVLNAERFEGEPYAQEYSSYISFLTSGTGKRRAAISDFQELRQEIISFYKGLL
jgi:hypothetical protein